MLLDKYDCALIGLFKSCKPYLQDNVMGIWADRCSIQMEYVKLSDVNRHLLMLAHKLGLFETEYAFETFVFSLQPEGNWRYTSSQTPFLQTDTQDFNLIMLTRLDSLFTHTESSKLPGYSAWAKMR